MIITKKFFLIKEIKCEYNFIDIKSYLHERAIGYDVFRIKFKNEYMVKILIESDEKNISVFFQFLDEFEDKIKNFNLIKVENVLKSLTIYQSKLGYLYAIIIGLILSVLPFFYMINGKFNLSVSLIMYPAGLLYIYKVYLERKK